MQVQPYLFFDGRCEEAMVADRFGVAWMVFVKP
jgi:uncharacterized glyoxalase superfamily protein PhnB